MKLNPRSPWWPVVALVLVLCATLLWPRTLWRRKRGPKLLAKRESLSERLAREGVMGMGEPPRAA